MARILPDCRVQLQDGRVVELAAELHACDLLEIVQDFAPAAQGPVGIGFVSGGGGGRGDAGPQGPAASGVQGPQGPFGGPQGAQGPQGQQGFQGAQGFQGPQGTGAQGPQGQQGPQGNQGNQGFQGGANAPSFITESTVVSALAAGVFTSVSSLTPAAGTYAIWFGGHFTSVGATSALTLAIFIGGVETIPSERACGTASGAAISGMTTFARATVDGATAIEGRVFLSGGGVADINRRQLMLVQVVP
jgi:hypothetical protein